jgi:hypothetical protein
MYARGYPSSTHQSSSPRRPDAGYELERVIDLPGGQNIVQGNAGYLCRALLSSQDMSRSVEHQAKPICTCRRAPDGADGPRRAAAQRDRCELSGP